MQLTKLLILFFSLTINLLAFGQKDPKTKSLAEIFSPPNGRYLRDSIFIDETEIANIHWLEYLHYVAKDSSQSFYLNQLPDTARWINGFKPSDSVALYVDHYLRYPGYRYFPVVGISYEQALNYCKWRGKTVTDHIKRHSLEKEYSHLALYNVIVEFRLPTIEEWEFAAYGGLTKNLYPYGFERPLKDKMYTFKIGHKTVCKCLDENNIKYNRSDIIHRVEFNLKEDLYFNLDGKAIECPKNSAFDLRYVFDSKPNHFGLYNMIGNIAEMTSTKGVSKGGSFRHTLAESIIQNNLEYNTPEAWLGFRCIAVVHLKLK